LNHQAEVIVRRIKRLIYNIMIDKIISKSYIYTPLKFTGLEIAEAKMGVHFCRIHHIERLLLKNEGHKIMKEYCNMQGETIPKIFPYLNLEHNLKEVNINWKY
jgi:hypothetical protein